VTLVQYDGIDSFEPLTLLERCSLSETKYLLERSIQLIISKVSLWNFLQLSTISYPLNFVPSGGFQLPTRVTVP